MAFYSAAVSGDTAACAAGAAEVETFALAEGATAVCAEAAFLWVCAGRLDRARALVHTFHGPRPRRPAPRCELAADPAVRPRSRAGRRRPRHGRQGRRAAHALRGQGSGQRRRGDVPRHHRRHPRPRRRPPRRRRHRQAGCAPAPCRPTSASAHNGGGTGSRHGLGLRSGNRRPNRAGSTCAPLRAACG